MRTCSRNDHIQCESKNDSACKICPVEVSNEETRETDYRKFLEATRESNAIESNATEYKKLLKAQKGEKFIKDLIIGSTFNYIRCSI